MESFRTEIENPVVASDIIDPEQKIFAFKNNNIDEEKFRSLLLARGVYGQRQQGVQMVRIKIPYGKFSSKQLLRISDVADRYSNGNLHILIVGGGYVALEKLSFIFKSSPESRVTIVSPILREETASFIKGKKINYIQDKYKKKRSGKRTYCHCNNR